MSEMRMIVKEINLDMQFELIACEVLSISKPISKESRKKGRKNQYWKIITKTKCNLSKAK